MVASFHNGDDSLARQKAVTAELNQLPLREVMETFLGFQGKKGGAHMLKYEVAPGFYLNCSTAEPWFASFNGVPIPGLNGRNPNASFGAINLVIAVRSILGDSCDFKRARTELQQAFLPASLGEGYRPTEGTGRRAAIIAHKTEEKEVPKELPARFQTGEEYVRLARANHYRPLAKLPDDLDRHVFRYLTETRLLPPTIVTELMARNAAYPSVRERRLVSPKTGDPYYLAEPMVVFPLTSWKEGFAIGYDYKTLPVDSDYPSFGATEGRKKFGGYQVGTWNDQTRQVILTEAAIDALSKWALDNPPPDTCIWGLSGARVSESLLRRCKERGVEVRTAFDNDPAGRAAASATLRRCHELDLPCSCEFVSPSEIDFELADDADAPGRLDRIASACKTWGIAIEIEESGKSPGLRRGVLANEAAVLDLLVQFRKDDTLDRITKDARGDAASSAVPRISFEIRNKDWNDLLRGAFQSHLTPKSETHPQTGRLHKPSPYPEPSP